MKLPKPRPPRPHSSRLSSASTRRQRAAAKPSTVTSRKKKTKTPTATPLIGAAAKLFGGAKRGRRTSWGDSSGPPRSCSEERSGGEELRGVIHRRAPRSRRSAAWLILKASQVSPAANRIRANWNQKKKGNPKSFGSTSSYKGT